MTVLMTILTLLVGGFGCVVFSWALWYQRYRMQPMIQKIEKRNQHLTEQLEVLKDFRSSLPDW